MEGFRKGGEMKRIIWLLFFQIIFFLSCAKNVAKVGSTTITTKDLSCRARVSEIYYPGSGDKEYIALAQLIKGYLSEEVLKSMGYVVDNNVIDSESKRIDNNTKAPEVLERIKKIYGRDKEGYYKTFVRIVYAERYLYNEVFLKSPAIHKAEREQIEKFLDAVRNSPERFHKIADEYKLIVNSLRISEKGIMDAKEDQKENRTDSSGAEQAKYILDKIKDTKPGSVYPEIIEWLEGYQVIKVVKRKDNEFVVDSVSVSKGNYDDWFWSIAKDIPVVIYDKTLKNELLHEVGWAKNLNLR